MLNFFLSFVTLFHGQIKYVLYNKNKQFNTSELEIAIIIIIIYSSIAKYDYYYNETNIC